MDRKRSYLGTKSYFKGKIFELVLRELLSKAGFSPNVNTSQLTKNNQRLHGRGSTYDPDVLGVFSLGIPFVNPLILIGEAKFHAAKVGLSVVREFLGSFIDFSQYPSINTRAKGETRYFALYETRFTYCPVFFATRGFKKSAEGLMYAHGINYVSYENSSILNELLQLIEKVLADLSFTKFEKEDFKVSYSFEELKGIRSELIKGSYLENVNFLQSYINRIDSILGVLDQRYPIHILYPKKINASVLRKIRIVKNKKGNFIIENEVGRKYGEFSLGTLFISNYVKYALKFNKTDHVFKQIDIIRKYKDNWEIRQLLIQDQSRVDLINTFK